MFPRLCKAGGAGQAAHCSNDVVTAEVSENLSWQHANMTDNADASPLNLFNR